MITEQLLASALHFQLQQIKNAFLKRKLQEMHLKLSFLQATNNLPTLILLIIFEYNKIN